MSCCRYPVYRLHSDGRPSRGTAPLLRDETASRVGEDVIVTDHRRPVLRVSRYTSTGPPDQIYAGLQGRVRYVGDIDEPTENEWNLK